MKCDGTHSNSGCVYLRACLGDVSIDILKELSWTDLAHLKPDVGSKTPVLCGVLPQTILYSDLTDESVSLCKHIGKHVTSNRLELVLLTFLSSSNAAAHS